MAVQGQERRGTRADGVWRGLPEGTRNSPGLNAAPLMHFLPMTPGPVAVTYTHIVQAI